jgi:hypothetical protein
MAMRPFFLFLPWLNTCPRLALSFRESPLRIEGRNKLEGKQEKRVDFPAEQVILT